MPEFASVVFTITNIRVARLRADGTYDPVSYSLQYGSEMSFEVEADTDQIKSYGMIVALLSIVTSLAGTLKQAAIDPPGLNIMVAVDDTSTGSTPNRVATADFLAGGAGLPYFGAAGDFAAENGANAHLGLRKMKLDTMPGWMVEQNKFRLDEVKFRAIPIDTTTRKMHRLKRNETSAALPEDLNTFFA